MFLMYQNANPANSISDVQRHWEPPSASALPAAVATADPADNGPVGVTDDDSGAEGVVHPITQDEDMDDHVFAKVSHQLENVAEDSFTEELFDRIDRHKWHEGQLMLQIQWKTNKISVLLFLLVKRDFPSVVATSYILEHKVGSKSGRYTGGCYTRLARQYNRAFQRVVCRLLQCQFGSTDTSATIEIASHLPDGTRLICQAVREVA